MKKFLSLALALVMTMSLVTISAGAKDFTDDSKITYDEAVDVISALEIVDGYADGDFRPTNTLTRGAAAKIISNLILGPTTAGALPTSVAPFKDVPAGSTFAGYIAYCSQQKIINGYSDGTFRPSGTLNGYAFMKMLLGALGYDGAIEGFTGANWSVNVAKLAMGIGLDEGLTDGFNGSKAVTREEACLYAFNTLKATMVEYNDKGSTITVGGVEIVTSPSSYTEVKNNTKTDGNIDGEENGDGLMQFGEKYFSDLEIGEAGSTDAFMRPSNVWTLDNEEIGTYAKTPDATYTEKVESGEIYSDLGLAKEATYDVYTDGVQVDGEEFTLSKGEEDAKIGGNGVQVEVYKDAKTIIVINTYVGEVSAVEEATSKKDAYVVIDPKSGSVNDDEFETEDFEEGDIVLYTYSNKRGEDCIQSMAATETVVGEVESYTGDSKVVVDGTTYKYSDKASGYVSSTGVDYTLYLDSYGYVIHFDEGDVTNANYAYVLANGVESNRGSYTPWAKLLYTDGTVATVDTTQDHTGASLDDGSLAGKFVTYKTNSKGETVLTLPSGAVENASLSDNESIEIISGKSTIDLGSLTTDSANTATTFLLYSEDDGEAKVYTGIKNVPDVDGSTKAAVFTKKGASRATIVVVYTDGVSVDFGTDKTIFIVADDADKTVTSDGDYYVFDAVVDGAIKEIKLDAATGDSIFTKLIDNGTNLLFKDFSVDGDIYSVKSADLMTNVDTDDGIYQTASAEAVKASNGVVGLGGDDYTLADDVVVFRVSASGTLSKTTISAVRTDGSDYYKQISFTVNDDGEVNMIVIALK